MDKRDIDDLIIQHCQFVAPRLVSEIKLYLAVEDLPIWRMDEDGLADIGLTTPFWAFAWAGGQALARYILDHPEQVAGKRVLDFGSGSGLVALAAMMAGAEMATASDLDPVSLRAMALNAKENGLQIMPSQHNYLEQNDLLGAFDIILIGDVCYDKEIADIVIPWAQGLAATGHEVLIGDPGRFYLNQIAGQIGLTPCARYSVQTTNLMEDSDLRNARVWAFEG